MLIDFKMDAHFFESEIQGKKPHLFKNGVANHSVNWKLINNLIQRHDHASSNFKILNKGLILKYDYLEEYQEVFTRKYRTIKSKLYDLMKEGASLALNKIENCQETDILRNQIAQFTGRQTIVSGYAAFGQEPSFGNHWDTHDVFAIQLIGRKRWTIYEPTEQDPLYTNSSVGKEDQCTNSPYVDLILEPGDIFYLPRGWWHEVTATGSETFHLAIGTYPPYITDYLSWLNEVVSSKNSDYRLPVEESALTGNALKRIASSFSECIVNKDNQRDFLQWFCGQQRLDSPFAIEYFGNPNAPSVPDESLIGINASNCRLWHDDEIIINGVKLKPGMHGKAVLKLVEACGCLAIKRLIELLPELPSDDIRHLVLELVRQDLLSIHLPSN